MRFSHNTAVEIAFPIAQLVKVDDGIVHSPAQKTMVVIDVVVAQSTSV